MFHVRQHKNTSRSIYSVPVCSNPTVEQIRMSLLKEAHLHGEI